MILAIEKQQLRVYIITTQITQRNPTEKKQKEMLNSERKNRKCLKVSL